MATVEEPFRWHYLVYRITNVKTGRIYVGQHRTVNPDDGYMGSGSELLAEYQACRDAGVPISDVYRKEILHDFRTFKEMDDMERSIVTEEFVRDPATYNRCLGGNGLVNYPRGCLVIRYNGRSGSLRDWSEWIGLSPEIIRQRLKKGMSMKQIIDTPPRRRDRLWTNSAGESHTLNEWSRISGLAYNLILRRLKMGWNLDRAISREDHHKRYEYKGRLMTLDELAPLATVNKRTLRSRIENYGWTPEKAVDTPYSGNPVSIWERKFEWRGGMYTIDELVEMSNGALFRRTVKDRILAGWDMEKIMSTPSPALARPLESRVRYEYKGELYTMDQAVKQFGRSETAIRSRMKKGMTFAQAVDAPLERNRNELIEAFGEKKTLNEWSRETGMPYAVIRSRIRAYGMSPEEAMSKPFRGKYWRNSETSKEKTDNGRNHRVHTERG